MNLKRRIEALERVLPQRTGGDKPREINPAHLPDELLAAFLEVFHKVETEVRGPVVDYAEINSEQRTVCDQIGAFCAGLESQGIVDIYL